MWTPLKPNINFPYFADVAESAVVMTPRGRGGQESTPLDMRTYGFNLSLFNL